jgi:putative hydrolase of the HAD superfamily
MSLLRFRALTIDVVGTLIDHERGMLDYLYAVAPEANVQGRDFLAACREARASPLALYFPDDLERVWTDVARQFGLPLQAAAGFRASVARWPAFADTAAALQRLKKHFRLVAATDAQGWAMAAFERTLKMPFEFSVTCDETGREKPDPRYFVALRDRLAREDVRQAETLHVGHSAFHDIRIAQALGWRTCWIERQASRPQDKPVRPDWRFATLRELAYAVEAEAAGINCRETAYNARPGATDAALVLITHGEGIAA